MGILFADPMRLVTLSSVKARPLAMGGAYVSIENDLFALDFNPAAFSVNAIERAVRFSMYFNPLSPVIIVENWNKISGWDDRLGFMIYGIAFSYGRLNVGILYGEEALSDERRLERRSFFNGTGYPAQKNSSMGFSISLSPRVSLGAVGELYHREEKSNKHIRLGYRYGIVIKPRNSLSVGLCFCNFPNDYKEDRIVIERLADETLNIGVSYRPWRMFTVALDIRNVSDEEKKVVREPHMGFELDPFSFVSLRGGYYRDWEGDEETYSVGIGLHSWESAYAIEQVYVDPFFRLDTALLWRHHLGETERWFIVSCVFKI
ncbi:hypothetical protein JW824_01975 [bacterium]|nr:hypothetical protein [bacterium]